MLELRPNCQLCDRDLPPDSYQARICSYECTYCAECVEQILRNVCPTCGGGFAPRPIRPRKSWRSDKRLGLSHDPASTKRVLCTYPRQEIEQHVARIEKLAPHDR
ncbi:MAG: DUF1272 domain-containing protein [Pseudomonadota bacterium]